MRPNCASLPDEVVGDLSKLREIDSICEQHFHFEEMGVTRGSHPCNVDTIERLFKATKLNRDSRVMDCGLVAIYFYFK